MKKTSHCSGKAHFPWLVTTCLVLLLLLDLNRAVDAFASLATKSWLGQRRLTRPTDGPSPLLRQQPSKCLHGRSLRLEATLASSDVDQMSPRNETSSSSSDFAPPKSKPTGRSTHQAKDRNEREKFADDYVFNEALNKLAEQAGDARQPVIRRAAACEDMWKDFCSSPQEKWQPDTISLNTVLKAWARAGAVLVDQHSDSSTPQHLLDPDIHIFSARECAQHALDILDAQEKLADTMHNDDDDESASTSARPDIKSYNSVMDAWAKSRTQESMTHVQALMKRMMKRKFNPDRISYTALMEAYAYSDKEDRLEEIQKIWNYMESQENPKAQPNAQSLVVLLHAYSRIAAVFIQSRDRVKLKQLADQALSFVRMQEERYEESQSSFDQPDVMVYTAAIDLLGKVGTPDYVKHAESMWQRLKESDCHPNKPAKHLQPTIYTYTSLITAWSRITDKVPEATQRIADLLDELVEDRNVVLNARPFAAALRGYGRSRYPLAEEPNKAIVALNMVKRLRELAKQHPTLRLNLFFYHAAIECCGRVLSSQELRAALSKDGSTVQCESIALKIAFALLQTMIVDNVTPNKDTYSKLLLCTSTLLPTGEERTRIAVSVFVKAKKAGVVDKGMLMSLQNAVDATYWQGFVASEKLFNERGRMDWSKIPHAWTRNIY